MPLFPNLKEFMQENLEGDYVLRFDGRIYLEDRVWNGVLANPSGSTVSVKNQERHHLLNMGVKALEDALAISLEPLSESSWLENWRLLLNSSGAYEVRHYGGFLGFGKKYFLYIRFPDFPVTGIPETSRMFEKVTIRNFELGIYPLHEETRFIRDMQ